MPRRVLDPTAERLDRPGVIDMIYPIAHDLPTPAPIRRALERAARRADRYPHGEAAVREALGAYVGVSPEAVLPTVGATGALDLACRTWLAGRRAAVATPAFWQLVDAPDRNGARVSLPPVADPDAVLDAFREADGVLLSAPNNPTGQLLDPALLDALLAVSRGRPVIVDESYADVAGFTAITAEMHPDLVVVRGFKTHLIPGARAGYLVGHPARVAQLQQLRLPFALNVFAEAAVLAVLHHIDLIRGCWAQLRADLRHLEAGLAALGGQLTPSHAVFACWRHPEAIAIARALAEADVYVLSAERPVIVGMPSDHLRLTARGRDVTERVLGLMATLPALNPR
ncbi:MAG: aminotransferase class I/II-fold pyridoxal phosphate-dependent enzyme [Alphaproteobacteria bacterium]|nr:aminotransferase class I/II-fold pyridoxal phosphate-dependent enzyme [Alphaproteobacteria bacterium]